MSSSQAPSNGTVSEDLHTSVMCTTYRQIPCHSGPHDNPAIELEDCSLDWSPPSESDEAARSTTSFKLEKDRRGIKQRCVCGAIILSVVIVIIIILVGALCGNSNIYEGNKATTSTPSPPSTYNTSGSDDPDLEGSFRLMKAAWDPTMSNVSSDEFRRVAAKYQRLINRIYTASKLHSIILYSVVTQLRKGSIIVSFYLHLKHSSNVTEDPSSVETYRNALEQPHLFLEAFQEGFFNLLAKQGTTDSDLSDISLPSLHIHRVMTTITTTSPPLLVVNSTTTTTTTIGTTMWTLMTSPATTQSTLRFPEPVSPCGQAGRRSGARILGGRAVEAGRFPWVVMVTENNKLQCGGSIMDSTHVITAAHCFANIGFPGIVHHTEVVAGEEDTDPDMWSQHVQRVPVARVYRHRDFNTGSQDQYDSNLNDIAVLRLSQPLTLNSDVSAVCLPQPADPLPSRCIVVGWGSTSLASTKYSANLQMVTLWTYNSSSCRDTFSQSFRLVLPGQNITSFLTEGVMCAANGTTGGQDACFGDSGGPLFCGPQLDDEGGEGHGEVEAGSTTDTETGSYTQFGVVSWGQSCAVPGSPGFYTYLPYFRPWLHRVALPVLDFLVKVGNLQCLEVSKCGAIFLTATPSSLADPCRLFEVSVNCTLHDPLTAACGRAVAEREVQQYVQYLNLESVGHFLNVTTCLTDNDVG